MDFYAFINSEGRVTQVIPGRGADETVDGISDWESYYGDVMSAVCVRTSAATFGGVHYTDGEPSEDQTQAFRFNYAGIGFTYDAGRDAFIPPTPYHSWVLDEATCLWEAPVAYPDDGKMYTWDETITDWKEVDDEAP